MHVVVGLVEPHPVVAHPSIVGAVVDNSPARHAQRGQTRDITEREAQRFRRRKIRRNG